jgi:uncharacterized protein (TIGR03545 family)
VFRTKFILFVLVPLIIIGLVVYLFIDGWVESGLEAGGESVVGARVEIDGTRVTLFPIGIQWARMQVANPRDTWKNLFETGPVRFSLDPNQLLRNKFIIETMEVQELILGTRRTTDGAIPSPPAREGPAGPSFTELAKEALEQSVQQTPVFNLDLLRSGFKPDSLLKAIDLRSLRYADSLKQQAIAAARQWDSVVADFETSKRRAVEIEAQIKAINPNELKTVDKITAAIATVDASIKSAGEISRRVTERKNTVDAQLRGVSASVASLDDVVRSDFERVKGLARLPELNTSGIARVLVGKEMYDRAMTYLSWVDFARTNISKYTPTPARVEKPPRFRGQDIRFPITRAYPKFWIRKVLVSGGTDTSSYGDLIRARGEILNVTNDQTVTGFPMTVALEGEVNRARRMTLRASFDRTKEIPYDSYIATLSGVPLASFQLGRSDFLDGRMTDARMDAAIQIQVPGSRLDAVTRLGIGGFSLKYGGEPRGSVERLVRQVLEGIRSFDVQLRFWNTSGPFDVALKTDLDDKIAARVKEVLGAEVARLQNELRAKFDAKVGEKRRDVEQFIAGKTAEVERQLAAGQALVNEKLGVLESKKKELNARLEQEKKKGVDGLMKLLQKK